MNGTRAYGLERTDASNRRASARSNRSGGRNLLIPTILRSTDAPNLSTIRRDFCEIPAFGFVHSAFVGTVSGLHAGRFLRVSGACGFTLGRGRMETAHFAPHGTLSTSRMMRLPRLVVLCSARAPLSHTAHSRTGRWSTWGTGPAGWGIALTAVLADGSPYAHRAADLSAVRDRSGSGPSAKVVDTSASELHPPRGCGASEARVTAWVSVYTLPTLPHL